MDTWLQPGLSGYDNSFIHITSITIQLIRCWISVMNNDVHCSIIFSVINSLRPSAHICVSKLSIIGSDNGLSPGRRQAIIWTNDGLLLIESLGTNFNEILIGIKIFSFKKMSLKMSSWKWRPFCLGLYVLNKYILLDAHFISYYCENQSCIDSFTKFYRNIFLAIDADVARSHHQCRKPRGACL